MATINSCALTNRKLSWPVIGGGDLVSRYPLDMKMLHLRGGAGDGAVPYFYCSGTGHSLWQVAAAAIIQN